MSDPKLTTYLGRDVATLLESPPFNGWSYEKTVEDDLDEPRVGYIFHGRGVEVSCDASKSVRAIFVRADDRGDAGLLDIPFTANRSSVRETFGTPSRTGEPSRDAVLGDFGAWDRFDLDGYSIHVEYNCAGSGIRMVTLMRRDPAR